LGQSGQWVQLLGEDEVIIADPKSSPEERCTCLDGVAVAYHALGNRDAALKAIA
jgi:hypothetical protein